MSPGLWVHLEIEEHLERQAMAHRDLQEKRASRECLEDQESPVHQGQRVNLAKPLQRRVNQEHQAEMESPVSQEVQVHLAAQDNQDFQVCRVPKEIQASQALAYLDPQDPRVSQEPLGSPDLLVY